MKKLLTLLAIATLVTATNITPTQSALCVQPKGQLQGTINQLEAQGYSLASIECSTINYFVAPTPPYVNRILSAHIHKEKVIHYLNNFPQIKCELLLDSTSVDGISL